MVNYHKYSAQRCFFARSLKNTLIFILANTVVVEGFANKINKILQTTETTYHFIIVLFQFQFPFHKFLFHFLRLSLVFQKKAVVRFLQPFLRILFFLLLLNVAQTHVLFCLRIYHHNQIYHKIHTQQVNAIFNKCFSNWHSDLILKERNTQL